MLVTAYRLQGRHEASGAVVAGGVLATVGAVTDGERGALRRSAPLESRGRTG